VPLNDPPSGVERILQNPRQNVFSKVSQILAVGIDALAASLAARCDDTPSTQGY